MIIYKIQGVILMVFVNEKWNGTGEIVVYSNYHKYWLDRERKIKNPLFDVFSEKILDLKEGKVLINWHWEEIVIKASI